MLVIVRRQEPERGYHSATPFASVYFCCRAVGGGAFSLEAMGCSCSIVRYIIHHSLWVFSRVEKGERLLRHFAILNNSIGSSPEPAWMHRSQYPWRVCTSLIATFKEVASSDVSRGTCVSPFVADCLACGKAWVWFCSGLRCYWIV